MKDACGDTCLDAWVATATLLILKDFNAVTHITAAFNAVTPITAYDISACSSRFFDFVAAMPQIRQPKTAFATTSAIE